MLVAIVVRGVVTGRRRLGRLEVQSETGPFLEEDPRDTLYVRGTD